QRFGSPFEGSVRGATHLLRGRIARSCPKSLSIFGLNLFELLFDETVNFRGFFTQVPELPESSHPRLFRCLAVGNQLVLHRFRDKFAKRDSAFGRNGFGTTKDGIGNFQSGLHEDNLPYLWEIVNRGSMISRVLARMTSHFRK